MGRLWIDFHLASSSSSLLLEVERNISKGGNLAHDVLGGVAQPLVEGDDAVLVRVHLLELALTHRDPLGIVLEHGGGGRGESEATGGHHGGLDHLVKLDVVDSSIPRLVGCVGECRRKILV